MHQRLVEIKYKRYSRILDGFWRKNGSGIHRNVTQRRKRLDEPEPVNLINISCENSMTEKNHNSENPKSFFKISFGEFNEK